MKSNEKNQQPEREKAMKPQISETKGTNPLTRPILGRALALLAALACWSNSRLLADNIVTSAPPSIIRNTLGLFLEMAARDPGLTSLLGKHKLLLQYSIRDLGVNCYIGFDGTKVVAALDHPWRQPEVVFVSDASTLDSLLRDVGGETDAQMTVHLGLVRKLKLSKDLKPIRAALGRIYSAACEKATAEAASKKVTNG
jgi:hypothetical protein